MYIIYKNTAYISQNLEIFFYSNKNLHVYILGLHTKNFIYVVYIKLWRKKSVRFGCKPGIGGDLLQVHFVFFYKNKINNNYF